MDFTSDIDTEKIQRQVIKVLYDGLNQYISDTQGIWTNEDTDYFASIGRAAPAFTVESIDDENFYPGTVPSLINADIEKYPNCTAIAYEARPSNSADDTADLYQVTLQVAIMCKSMSDELEVNSRIQKTLQAAHVVLMGNRTFNKSVSAQNGPLFELGDVFVRKQSHGHGPRWFWQGGTLTYLLVKYVNFV